LSVITVATDDSNAYYQIVSRLKLTHLRFYTPKASSPESAPQGLVVTSKAELPAFGSGAVAIEDLSDDPIIMEGQLLSRLTDESNRDVVVGVDPGSRIGVALFYAGRELGALSLTSTEKAVELLVRLVEEVPHSSVSVKVGAGDPASSQRLARALRERLPTSASLEIVDESGTSGRRGGAGGDKDQRAAARIAFRKGVRFNGAAPPQKTRGQS
jgi:hypothetical protein